MLKSLVTGLLILAISPAFLAADANSQPVKEIKITILSTMLSEFGIGEWGFAALVEVDGRRVLFDTGSKPDTVWRNAEQLGIDLSTVEDVILSHNHKDHTGGLVALRERYGETNETSLAKAHVAEGIFWERQGAGYEHIMSAKRDYESLGGLFHVHSEPHELQPGVWLTGPVPRVHPEKNYTVREGATVTGPGGTHPDNIPESMSMVIETQKGLVVISGCGHAGIINTLEHAQSLVADNALTSFEAAIGGFHLANASADHLDWTASKLRALSVNQFIGAHCTGLEPVYHFRQSLGLPRSNAVVGAVGATYTLQDGIRPGWLAR
jgi:7,8-dihydropterin-6-yl-methyl-4-(beta-D-ribofuranosyl)aminobenzene 5'-phosphate synthase